MSTWRPWAPRTMYSGAQYRFNSYRLSISESQSICGRKNHIRETMKKVRKQHTDVRSSRKLRTAGRKANIWGSPLVRSIRDKQALHDAHHLPLRCPSNGANDFKESGNGLGERHDHPLCDVQL